MHPTDATWSSLQLQDSWLERLPFFPSKSRDATDTGKVKLAAAHPAVLFSYMFVHYPQHKWKPSTAFSSRALLWKATMHSSIYAATWHSCSRGWPYHTSQAQSHSNLMGKNWEDHEVPTGQETIHCCSLHKQNLQSYIQTIKLCITLKKTPNLQKSKRKKEIKHKNLLQWSQNFK